MRTRRVFPSDRWSALGLFVISFATLAYVNSRPVGGVYSIGLPVCLGLAWFGSRGGGLSQWAQLVAFTVSLTGAAYLFDLTGLFCWILLVVGVTGIGAAVYLVVWGLSAFLSYLFRSDEDDPDPTRRKLSILLPLLLIPALEIELRYRPPDPLVSYRTPQILDDSAGDVWSALRFYDELRHEPPLVLKLGLPRPRSTSGPVALGREQVCVYDKGIVRKVCTALEPGSGIAFRVCEQRMGFERSIHLRDGSYQLRALPAGGTEVTVETRYVAHLKPRWLWTPIEGWVLQGLHGYLLEGLTRSLDTGEGRPGAARAP